jgi:hypothetical protein
MLMAATPDYFPLHVGNQWIYRISGLGSGEPVIVHIPRTEVVQDRIYSLVRGLSGGDVWLRMDENATLLRYDPETRQESTWAMFSTPAGETYRTELDPCNRTAKVESRQATVRTPAGEFINALAISYPSANCADAGLSSEFYLPWIGLVRRESLTIAGPRVMSLSYARIGGVTVLSEPENAFSLTLDRSQYGDPANVPLLTARLTLRMTHPEPVELTFPSGQRFDLEIRNERNETVLRWSDGKAFTLALGSERIGPGEKNWTLQLPLANGATRLPPGSYTAEGWLTTIGERRYAARVPFSIIGVR